DERIVAATHINHDDQKWLSERLGRLRDEYNRTQPTHTNRLVHGDAWQGNVAVPAYSAPLLLDLEHFSHGDPDWDLIPIAVDHTDFARLTADEYHAFIDSYGGHDVTTTPKFRLMADIQELRWVCFALGKAADSPTAERETEHRIACLRGDMPRPWAWTAF